MGGASWGAPPPQGQVHSKRCNLDTVTVLSQSIPFPDQILVKK